MARATPKFFPRPALAISAVLSVILAIAAGGSATPALRLATSKEVLEEVHRPGAKVILVNVWATWCVPCREEFPDLVRLHRDFEKRGLRLVLVSADFDDDREKTVRKFLVAQGVSFPSLLKEEKDEEFIDGLDKRWSGALPVSLLYDGSGKQLDIWEGSATYDELKERVLEVLGASRSNEKTEEVKQSKEAR